MVWGYRYIVVEDGRVQTARETPIEDVTIDAERMTVPEMPTDAIYELYYNETDGLHWIKAADFEPEPPEEPTGETVTWDSMARAISEGVNEV